MKAKANLARKDAYASSTEREYAETLKLRKMAGEIYDWAYEPVRLRIGDGAFYRPDFQVINLNGVIEYHEVKGFWREAAKVRIRAAKALHPYSFFVVTKGKGVMTWKIEEI